MLEVILRKLTDRYAKDRGIEVTPKEIDLYVESLQRSIEQDRKQKEVRREAMTRKLESNGLSDDERKRVSSELERLNEFLANLEATANGAA